MAKYRVLRDNFGFKGGYWTEGQIVDLDDSEKPPKHFERLDGKPEPEVASDPGPRTFSEMNKKSEEEESSHGGFASSLKKGKPKK